MLNELGAKPGVMSRVTAGGRGSAAWAAKVIHNVAMVRMVNSTTRKALTAFAARALSYTERL
ncbi:MAG: hypothetical protein ACJAZO_002540 [Myxococcota bacterium]